MRRNISMPNVFWMVLALLMVLGLIVAPLVIAWRSGAEAPVRDVRQMAPSMQGNTSFGPFPALKPAVENVYIQQSLNAMYALGWNRGTAWDSFFDWQMGREFTFRPWDWDSNVWRPWWSKTPGERFAHWWTEYCILNCDKVVCQDEGCDEIEAQLAEGFDLALSAVTSR